MTPAAEDAGVTAVTEEVCRHQLRPVITKGVETKNTVFGGTSEKTA